MLSRELERYLQEAAAYAKENRHEFVTLEHVLLALLKSPLVNQLLEELGAQTAELKKKLRSYLAKNGPIISPESMKMMGGAEAWLPEFTVACHRVFQRAAYQVQSAGKNEVNEAHILIAMYFEKNSHAVFYLSEQGITQFDLIQAVSHGGERGLSLTAAQKSGAGEEDTLDIDGQEKDSSKKSLLEEFAVLLNKKVLEGKSDPVIGRDAIINRCLQVLSRRSKNNPLLIGEPGVGKTALAEGIAQRIVDKKTPEHLHQAEIWSLDLGSVLAGTKFRGDFENRIRQILKEVKKRPHAILFIDEIHTLVGAGATGGGSMDASNLLKPALASGELSCIGSTTHAEYRQHFEKDRALNRRFERIDVKEPSIEDAINILMGLKSKYEDYHQVEYTESAIKAAVELSSKYINGKFLPDKAIDVMDEAGAESRMARASQNGKALITDKQIEKVVALMAQVPVGTVGLSDKLLLKDLDKKLKALIFGQDEAIDKLVQAIKLSRSGLGKEGKPIGSFLFSGPTGVGKTEVSKQLAQILGVHFARFDMSEYMEKHAVSKLVGAPPGYVGYEQGGLLTETVNSHPHCVLLLDEIEKAHPDITTILLQVMDAGRATDSNGRVTDFKNTIVIMTTNAGAQDLQKGKIGILNTDLVGISEEAIKKAFAPEFINRLDAIVYFRPLSREIVLQVVDKHLHELSVQLMKKNVSLDVSEAVKEWIVKKSYQPAYGARPMARSIDDHIKRALVDEILFGSLAPNGGVVRVGVDVKTEQLSFTFEPSTLKLPVKV